MEVDEGSDQNWMSVLAHLKNEFTEDEKYHNLMELAQFMSFFCQKENN